MVVVTISISAKLHVLGAAMEKNQMTLLGPGAPLQRARRQTQQAPGSVSDMQECNLSQNQEHTHTHTHKAKKSKPKGSQAYFEAGLCAYTQFLW